MGQDMFVMGSGALQRALEVQKHGQVSVGRMNPQRLVLRAPSVITEGPLLVLHGYQIRIGLARVMRFQTMGL